MVVQRRHHFGADVIGTAGLCGTCSNAIIRPTRRGTVYLRCALAATDDRFPKYPRLPKRECEGYEMAAAPR